MRWRGSACVAWGRGAAGVAVMQRTNRRYLAADTQGPITSARLHSALLRDFLISQPSAGLGTLGLSSNCQPV